jgi:hypothetical protein
MKTPQSCRAKTNREGLDFSRADKHAPSHQPFVIPNRPEGPVRNLLFVASRVGCASLLFAFVAKRKPALSEVEGREFDFRRR